MDIRELRCGDIVTTNGKPMVTKKGDYYRVIEIDSKNKLDDFVGSVIIESVSDKYFGRIGAWIGCLEPIPLTDELLLKIGFKQVNKYIGDGIDYEFLNDYHCHIWHTLIDNSSYEYNIHTAESSKNIKYLHQLQHELYDAVIELKIEL